MANTQSPKKDKVTYIPVTEPEKSKPNLLLITAQACFYWSIGNQFNILTAFDKARTTNLSIFQHKIAIKFQAIMADLIYF